MITAGCTPISSHKVLGRRLLPNLTSDLHPGLAFLEGVSLGTGYPLLANPGGLPRVILPHHILGHLNTTRVLTGTREDRRGHLTGDL